VSRRRKGCSFEFARGEFGRVQMLVSGTTGGVRREEWLSADEFAQLRQAVLAVPDGGQYRRLDHWMISTAPAGKELTNVLRSCIGETERRETMKKIASMLLVIATALLLSGPAHAFGENDNQPNSPSTSPGGGTPGVEGSEVDQPFEKGSCPDCGSSSERVTTSPYSSSNRPEGGPGGMM